MTQETDSSLTIVMPFTLILVNACPKNLLRPLKFTSKLLQRDLIQEAVIGDCGLATAARLCRRCKIKSNRNFALIGLQPTCVIITTARNGPKPKFLHLHMERKYKLFMKN